MSKERLPRTVPALALVLLLSTLLPPAAAPAARATEGSVLDPQGACEYVVLTPRRLAASFQPLADHKTARGVRARVVAVEWVRALFPADSTAASLRTFLRAARRDWGVQWVLLGGDTVDQEGRELVPCQLVEVRAPREETIPADLYYAALRGGWDGNGNEVLGEVKDGVGLEPQVFVGRAPVRTPAEVAVFVDKVLRYESGPEAGCAERILWIGADFDGTTTGKDAVLALQRDALVPEHIESRMLSAVDGNLSRDAMVAELTSHPPSLLFVAGHGDRDLVQLGDTSFTSADADALQGDFPFVYVANSCLTNRFDDDSLTEHLLRNPRGGAVACWSSSRFSWYFPSNAGYGPSDVVLKDLFRLLYRDYLDEAPALGELTNRARLRFVESSRKDGTFRWLTYGMNLLGDPELRLWTAAPRLVVARARAVGDAGRPELEVRVEAAAGGAPVAGARVTAWRRSDGAALRVTVTGKDLAPASLDVELPAESGGELFATGRTDRAGSVRLAPSPVPGTAASLVDDVLSLSRSTAALEGLLRERPLDRERMERLSRDYRYAEDRVEDLRRNLVAFFKQQARSGHWAVAAEALDAVAARLDGDDVDRDALRTVVGTLSRVLAFDLRDLQAGGEGAAEVFRKLADVRRALAGPPAAQPPAAGVGPGNLMVSSEPAGADVLLDSVPAGTTPCKLQAVAPGEHVVTVSRRGATVASRTVVVAPGKTASCHLELGSLRAITGSVTLVGEPDGGGATVELFLLDASGNDWSGEPLARTTTAADGRFAFGALPEAPVQVRVYREGFEQFEQPVWFDQPDSRLEQPLDIRLCRLATLAGTASWGGGGTLRARLFSNRGRATTFDREVDVADGGRFAFEGLAPGFYAVFMTGPGLTVASTWTELKDGAGCTNLTLTAGPIRTVHLQVRAPRQREWADLAVMEQGEDGLFRVKDPEGLASSLPEGPHLFIYHLNRDDAATSSIARDLDHWDDKGRNFASGDLRVIAKDLRFDPTKAPTYSRSDPGPGGVVEHL